MENGELHIALGPMFAGKTTWLLQQANSHIMTGFKVLYLNSSIDIRSDSNISTHNALMGNDVEAKFDKDAFTAMKVHSLGDVDEKTLSSFDVVLIDESQFFLDLNETVIEWVDNLKKIVFIVGLNGDFKRDLFGSLYKLIPHCDSFQILNSYCRFCEKKSRKKAVFTKRLTMDDAEILIGGKDTYAPVCRHHYKM